MRNYELMLVLRPTLDEEARTEVINRVIGWVTGDDEAAEQPEVTHWGERKLAYQIKKQKLGYYLLIHANIDPDQVAEFERRIRFVDEILRHLVVRLEQKTTAKRQLDYKVTDRLRDYMNEHGQIMPRRRNRISAKQQRDLARAVKRARHLALLPFVVE